MGAAFFETSGVLRGNRGELAAMEAVLLKYTGPDQEVRFDKCEFRDCPALRGEGPEADSEEIEVSFDADGPYGKYDGLKEVPVFREMADAAPAAFFDIEVSGNTDFTEDELKCRLSGGLLRIDAETVNSEDQDEAYLDYLAEKMPFDLFTKLFRIEEDSLDEDDYRGLLNDLVIDCDEGMTPFDTDYDGFVEKLEDYGGKTELDEDGFEAVKAEAQERGILSVCDFREENDSSVKESRVYNPVTGNWMD